jgi:hypothetical protein
LQPAADGQDLLIDEEFEKDQMLPKVCEYEDRNSWAPGGGRFFQLKFAI